MKGTASLQADERAVLAANSAFYEALESLDLVRMDAVWLHEDWVQCLHPGWELLQGWEHVQESWASIFRSTVQQRVSISRPRACIMGDTAWVSCVEHVTSTFEAEFTTARVETLNIFVRRGGQWRMVHHHTTPVSDRISTEPSHTVQ